MDHTVENGPVVRRPPRHILPFMRQMPILGEPARGVAISTYARDYRVGSRVGAHTHGADQLVYASRGVMQVTSGQQVWWIPPQFGLWVPALTVHAIRMPEGVSMRTLYFRKGLVALSSDCAVLHVGSLLRELIFEAVRIGELRRRRPAEGALVQLLRTNLATASAIPTGISFPRDPRAAGVAARVTAQPGEHASLAALCVSCGLSVRTLERIFLREIGTSFERWRRQVRLMKGVELLVAGRSVKQIAHSVGYENPSAFVALFRETFGTTPKAWVRSLATAAVRQREPRQTRAPQHLVRGHLDPAGPTPRKDRD
jgi:AraC-like DNA-binding protein/quercetin dioxygenase-like cupin family protein